MRTVRHLRTMADLTPGEVSEIIESAFGFKKRLDAGMRIENILKGRVVSLIFEKPSLRTRMAFETAVASLGGIPIFQTGVEIFTRADGAKREAIGDIAHVLERYCSAIVARVHKHESIEEMASCVKIPVINALCDKHHPTQALADLMTVMMHIPKWQKAKVVFIGDGNNVATSLMQICTMTGLHFVHCGPPGYELPSEEIAAAKAFAAKSGGSVTVETDPAKAVKDAHAIYGDTFVSMGNEAETKERLKHFAPYEVNAALMKRANPGAIFLHCLPAHRGEEVTDEVMDSPQSKVFDLAENRMHVAKALLKFFVCER